ncbi:hypothetical protein ACM26V_21070 [Salipaludibacillus sp. HK11]|uniref:hypothetical protein n=1 Tax=Salipaludibacillus sp. HK11 TaxID=3394320 RepID=UPI0039FC62A0
MRITLTVLRKFVLNKRFCRSKYEINDKRPPETNIQQRQFRTIVSKKQIIVRKQVDSFASY